jgi:hypothetical protein
VPFHFICHSEVINGLVFKKGATHKQMRANIKHPKLLLLQGALGYCSTGFSSMNSMKQVCMHALLKAYLLHIARIPGLIGVSKKNYLFFKSFSGKRTTGENPK